MFYKIFAGGRGQKRNLGKGEGGDPPNQLNWEGRYGLCLPKMGVCAYFWRHSLQIHRFVCPSVRLPACQFQLALSNRITEERNPYRYGIRILIPILMIPILIPIRILQIPIPIPILIPIPIRIRILIPIPILIRILIPISIWIPIPIPILPIPILIKSNQIELN